jgi:WhiB family redox-sensing transcriptional regulator
MLNIDRPAWQEFAACRGAPTEMFFPEPGHSQAARNAKAICAGCEVRAECLSFALSLPGPGIYGGLTARERSGLLEI